MLVRPMVAGDWGQVVAIYVDGIATGHSTFADRPPAWVDWDAAHLPDHRFVAVGHEAEEVLGWTAVSGTSDRCVYSGVVEHSVYVAPTAQGQGVGSALLQALIASTEGAGIWTIQSGIFPENTASLALHAAYGFEPVGTRKRLGRMSHGPLAGTWRDVILVERRSAVAGT